MEFVERVEDLAALSYEERKLVLLSNILNYDHKNKNCIVQLAYTCKEFPVDILDTYLEAIRKQDDFVDFMLCVLIRLMHFDYGDDTSIANYLEKARLIMSKFPFWPISSKEEFKSTFGFWSENHTFMLLSSAHLFQQRFPQSDYDGIESKETFLLRSYLRAHCSPSFHGVYEVFSQVYLPYTLGALLNLIDFSGDAEIRALSIELANVIILQLCMGTTDKGVSSLTPSARTFQRCRNRNWGHGVNQIILILTGISVDKFKPAAISGFFLTSSYKPDEFINNYIIKSELYHKSLSMNHPIHTIDQIYQDLNENDKVTFLWYV